MPISWIRSFFGDSDDQSGGKDLLNALHGKIVQEFPQIEEQQSIVLTCIAGLLARVAYRDLSIDDGEKSFMSEALSQWCQLDSKQAEAVTRLALSDIQNLAGADNHLYAYPLESIFSEEQKFALLKALFAMAAADGSVENLESEEIRTISQRLSLSHQHFIAARATVLESLEALRKNT